MEIRDYLKKYGLIGVISDYEISLDRNGLVKDLNIKNRDKAFKMVNIDKNILDKEIRDISLDNLFKLDLLTKIDKEVIIVGNLSKCLNKKDIDYVKKLFLKLVNDYHKKIVIIDNDVKVFFDVVKVVLVLKDKQVVYETDNFYDDELYKYCKMPKIVEFIKYINRDNKRLEEVTDIYELIKDIYRSVS